LISPISDAFVFAVGERTGQRSTQNCKKVTGTPKWGAALYSY